jgi:hypothetical protein
MVRLFTALIRAGHQEQATDRKTIAGVSILKTLNIPFAPIVYANAMAALDRETQAG